MARILIVKPSPRAVASELDDQIRIAWQTMHRERKLGHEISATACKFQLQTLLEIRHWARWQTIHERQIIAEDCERARNGWKVLVGANG